MLSPVLRSCLILSLFSAFLFSAPKVILIAPESHRIDASRQAEIAVSFDVAIDPASITSASFMVFGRWSGVSSGSFQFENNNRKVVFLPDQDFSAGETVMVNLSRNILDSNGLAMEKGYAWQFWVGATVTDLFMAEIGRISTRQPGENHIQTYGANAADLNGDGLGDYLVPNENSHDVRVFLNNGAGSYSNFTVHALPSGNRPSTNESADFNGDGNTDIAVGNTQNSTVNIMLGDGQGGFSSISAITAGNGIRGLAVLDLNGDGAMDIVTANRGANNLALLLGNGDGTFASATFLEAGGQQETACVAGDANNDGITDLFVGCYGSNEIILMLGDGNGSLIFTDRIASPGSPWMMAAGDIDGDGAMDAVSANADAASAVVAFSDGFGGFSGSATYPTGAAFPIAVDLGDPDGDGDLDMITSSFGGFGQLNGLWRLYENNGSGLYVNPTDYPASYAASCAVFHDRDGDGDVDVTGIDEMHDLLFLFDNRLTSLHDSDAVPISDFELSGNFPNPFNPFTNIRFVLPDHARVNLTVYDLQGRKVRTLISGEVWRGGTNILPWNGTDDRGAVLASGVYFLRMSSNGISKTRKMFMLK